MTKEQFNITKFQSGMKVLFMGRAFEIEKVDFTACEVAIWYDTFEKWVKCKDIEVAP